MNSSPLQILALLSTFAGVLCITAHAQRKPVPLNSLASAAPDETEYDYFVYHDGVVVHAYDGQSGTIAYSDSNPTQVFQDTIAALSARGGGTIFVKSATYTFADTATTSSFYVGLTDNLLIRGGNSTILTTSPAPATPRIFFFGDGSENVTLADLRFENCNAEAIRFKGGRNVKILDCRFQDIQKQAVVNFTDLLDGIWIERCLVERAGMESSATGKPHYAGINMFVASNVFVRGCCVRECGGNGIGIWSSSGKVLVESNVCSRNNANIVEGQGHGIIVGGSSDDVIIRGNVVDNNGANGIEAGSGSPGGRYVISNNVAVANGQNTTVVGGVNYPNGIYVTDDTQSHVVVDGNVCVDGNGPGIKVGVAGEHQGIVVQGNVCANNGKGRASSNKKFHSGIVLIGPVYSAPTDEAVIVSGNLIYDNQANQLATQVRGIYCDPDVDGVLIEGNRVFGNGDGTGAQQIEFTSNPNMKVRRNVGFATEANGSATIVMGASAVTVAHGLDVTPDPNSFQVTPHTDLGSRSFWIDGITATTFIVNVSSPAAGSLLFGWSYVPH